MAVLEISTLALVGVGGLALLFLWLGLRFIPNDRVGIVEKRWSAAGSLTSGLIALSGEAGFQPDVLRGGVHFRMPFQYRVHKLSLVTIPQGKIGYVFARDGVALSPTQALASNLTATDFQDVRGFLERGGQRGPQRQILREGTYAIHLAQFLVVTETGVDFLPLGDEAAEFKRMAMVIAEREGFSPVVIKGEEDLLGIVTVHDGPSLDAGEIIAPMVETRLHDNFQDPERFLGAGGRRGRQLQVLVEGTYYINRLFATIEYAPKTVVEVGTVGVVVSYTGGQGQDLSGKDYSHGELVGRGLRGVWSEALMPGKYAFNRYAGNVIMVPTTNFILKWKRSEVGVHKFDENLTEVSLITKDAFEPSLPLSVVVHIDYRKAPLVIQRFGDIKRLVEQTLDPMVSAYFKNVGQTRTLIQLLQDRSAIQLQASDEMRTKFAHYNLELEEVLIGTPTSGGADKQIDQILTQLRARQIAEEQVETFRVQQTAAVKQRELKEAEARAHAQEKLTESEVAIQMQENEGKARYQKALQEAAQLRAMALAEADKTRHLAEADAERAARIGIAQAVAIEEQVRAYGGPRFQLTQQVMNRFAEAIEAAKVDIVPKIVVGGGAGGNGTGGNQLEALLALLLSSELGENALTDSARGERTPEAEALRERTRRGVLASLATREERH